MKKFKFNLTERENDVMQLVAKGFNNEQICQKLFISETTVKTHLNNAYLKLCVTTDKFNSKPVMTRLRAVLIYLGLAKYEDWI